MDLDQAKGFAGVLAVDKKGCREGTAVKKIPLTKGKFALVDDKDYEWLNRWKWQSSIKSKVSYAQRHIYDKDNKRYTTIQMHRLINDTPDGLITDHINFNGLDNRRKNLRSVTHRQNISHQNRVTSSKYTGVSWSKSAKAWRANIMHNLKLRVIGYYDEEIEAHKAYQEALSLLPEAFSYCESCNSHKNDVEFEIYDVANDVYYCNEVCQNNP